METIAEEKYGPDGGNPERRIESDQAVDWIVSWRKRRLRARVIVGLQHLSREWNSHRRI